MYLLYNIFKIVIFLLQLFKVIFIILGYLLILYKKLLNFLIFKI